MSPSLVLFALLALSAPRHGAEVQCNAAAEAARYDRAKIATPCGRAPIAEHQVAEVVETCIRSGPRVWGRLNGTARRRGCVASCRAGLEHGSDFARARGRAMCPRLCKAIGDLAE